jgi:hypothetical protein
VRGQIDALCEANKRANERVNSSRFFSKVLGGHGIAMDGVGDLVVGGGGVGGGCRGSTVFNPNVVLVD